MDKQTMQPAGKGALLPMILAVGGFFLFLVIVAVIWIGRSPSSVWIGGASPEERSQTLREHREREREMTTTYGWVDKEQGVVRLPVDRAMDLVLEELNQEQN